jgi:hypothetical protein
MTQATDDLCDTDRLLLAAFGAEYTASVVSIELLRKRLEGMLEAASMLAEHGAKGRDLLQRATRVTKNIVAVEAAQIAFKATADSAMEISAEVITAWRELCRLRDVVRDDLLALCFVDGAATVKPWVLAHVA